MATTSHGLSVLTNASVKPPLNPKTGLSNSLHERRGPDFCRLSGIYYDDYDERSRVHQEILDPKQKLATIDDPASIIQLGKLSDEEFYQKLLELKNEQRKILQKCEQIYIEKCNGEITPTFSGRKSDRLLNGESSWSVKAGQFKSSTNIDDDGILVSSTTKCPEPKRSDSPTLHERVSTPFEKAEYDLYSSKPPTGKSQPFYPSKSHFSPIIDRKRPSSAPIPHRRAQSIDDLPYADIDSSHSFQESDDDYIPDDTVSEPYRSRDISKTMSRIEGMWHDFSIEDYAPRRSQTQNIRSATEPRREKKKDEKWRHRLTIPEPFTMTLREEKKEKVKSKTQLEFEVRQLEKEMEEEEECKKKFKARPVPAHVYLPLYDEIFEKQEERRRQTRQMSAELLRSQEKPFSFMKREEDRKIHKRFERDSNKEPVKVSSETPSFKAKPVPKYVFDNSVDDKLMEEEEYRKIRMKMRSEELMKVASLPPSMAAREKAKEQEIREQKLKSKRKGKKSTRLRINHEVPNYDALYLQFQKELRRRKGQREATVAQPFRLSARGETMEKIKKDIERDEDTLKENRWPYKLPRKKEVNLGKFIHLTLSQTSPGFYVSAVQVF